MEEGVPESGPTGGWSAVVQGLLAGDRTAVARVNRLVTGVLVRLRAYDFRDEWDDLRQEVLLAVVASARAGRLGDPRAFAAYVRVVTRNKTMDRLRAHLRCGPGDTLAWEEVAGSVAAPAGDPLLHEVWRAAAGLPDDERRVLDGVYRQGKTYEEVSADTGIPLGTMKRRLREALAALRRRLAAAS